MKSITDMERPSHVIDRVEVGTFNGQKWGQAMTYALAAMMCFGVIFHVCADTSIPMWAAVPIVVVTAWAANQALSALSDDVTAYWREKLERAEREYGE